MSIKKHALSVECDKCHRAIQTQHSTVGKARSTASKCHWHPAVYGDGTHRASKKWSDSQTAIDLCPQCYHQEALKVDDGRPRFDCYVCNLAGVEALL